MAKLPIKLPSGELRYAEVTIEELIEYENRQAMHVKNSGSSGSESDKNELKEKKELKDKFSRLTVNDFIRFITSKDQFIHDAIEVQLALIGRPINSKTNFYVYSKFNYLIKDAREQISKEKHGKWVSMKNKQYDNNANAKVYKFVPDQTPNVNEQKPNVTSEQTIIKA